MLNKTFGCSRFIYNTMLSERKEVYAKLKDKPRELYEYKYRTEKQLKKETDINVSSAVHMKQGEKPTISTGHKVGSVLNQIY